MNHPPEVQRVIQMARLLVYEIAGTPVDPGLGIDCRLNDLRKALSALDDSAAQTSDDDGMKILYGSKSGMLKRTKGGAYVIEGDAIGLLIDYWETKNYANR